MNSDPTISAELRTLIEAAFEERLDQPQLARLDELLVSDPEACLAYVQYMSMVAGLRRFLVGPPSFVGDIEKTASAGFAELLQSQQLERRFAHAQATLPAPAIECLPADKSTPPSESTLGFIADSFRQGSEALPRIWLFVVLIIASTLVAFFVMINGQHREPEPMSGDSQPRHIASRGNPASPDLPPDIALAKSGINSVRLDSGTARWSIKNVGWVVAEGPVDFDLLSPMRARITRGRIKMRVTEETGHGFVVETPYGEVTDLGTEFGLDLTEQDQAGLVVFEGSVDLRVAEAKPLESARVQRLVGGEGVVFNKGGPIDRINSIITGSVPTFMQNKQAVREGSSRIFRNVIDNSTNTRKFYEIVPGGLREDVRAYVDRPHQWNGVTALGMPSYLVGADYVKTFNEDNVRKNIEVFVTLGCPATLYLFIDDRLEPPAWLRKSFQSTCDKIGLDGGPWGKMKNRRVGNGPGRSVDDMFTIWKREVREPETIVLGSNESSVKGWSGPAMYGIAGGPLEVGQPTKADISTDVAD